MHNTGTISVSLDMTKAFLGVLQNGITASFKLLFFYRENRQCQWKYHAARLVLWGGGQWLHALLYAAVSFWILPKSQGPKLWILNILALKAFSIRLQIWRLFFMLLYHPIDFCNSHSLSTNFCCLSKMCTLNTGLKYALKKTFLQQPTLEHLQAAYCIIFAQILLYLSTGYTLPVRINVILTFLKAYVFTSILQSPKMFNTAVHIVY